MKNFEAGESSRKKYKATDTNDDEIPIELFKETTSPKEISPAYPLSTPNLTTLANHPNDPLDTDLADCSERKAPKDCELVPVRKMRLSKEMRRHYMYREASKKLNDPKKSELEELNDKAREIARETNRLRKEIMRHSEEILEYKAENEVLLEELRRGVCDQETISRYESLNPVNQTPVRPSSNESDRDNNNASSSSGHSSKKPSSVIKTRIKLTSNK